MSDTNVIVSTNGQSPNTYSARASIFATQFFTFPDKNSATTSNTESENPPTLRRSGAEVTCAVLSAAMSMHTSLA